MFHRGRRDYGVYPANTVLYTDPNYPYPSRVNNQAAAVTAIPLMVPAPVTPTQPVRVPIPLPAQPSSQIRYQNYLPIGQIPLSQNPSFIQVREGQHQNYNFTIGPENPSFITSGSNTSAPFPAQAVPVPPLPSPIMVNGVPHYISIGNYNFDEPMNMNFHQGIYPDEVNQEPWPMTSTPAPPVPFVPIVPFVPVIPSLDGNLRRNLMQEFEQEEEEEPDGTRYVVMDNIPNIQRPPVGITYFSRDEIPNDDDTLFFAKMIAGDYTFFAITQEMNYWIIGVGQNRIKVVGEKHTVNRTAFPVLFSHVERIYNINLNRDLTYFNSNIQRREFEQYLLENFDVSDIEASPLLVYFWNRRTF